MVKRWYSLFVSSVTAVFCCVGALAITGSLHHVDKDSLGWWLCERQLKAGGLNGRPEKLADVGIKLISNERDLCMISLVLTHFLLFLFPGLLFLVGPIEPNHDR